MHGMKKEHNANVSDTLWRIADKLPWSSVGLMVGEAVYNWWRNRLPAGMYETLRYASTLELLDAEGNEACFAKEQDVRYLQDDIIAFQDQIWSDGAAPLDYRCTPGFVVDRYRPAQQTILLISLRGRRQRGETDNFHIQWRIRNGFRRSHEVWQTTLYYPTHAVSIRVIFPAARPPQQVWGIEERSKRRYPLGEQSMQHLPDGRWLVHWSVAHPRHHAVYSLHWRW